MIDIFIVVIIIYSGFNGYKVGGLRQLSNMIAYFFAFILARLFHSFFSDSLSIFIYQEALKDKVSFLIAFLIIAYIFKILFRSIENLIHIKFKNHYTGLIFGMINSILIISLYISVLKEILPNTFNINSIVSTQSKLYIKLDDLQKNYLIQYKKNQK